MKFSKSVTFDLKTIDIVDEYMDDNDMVNFSKAINELILEGKRFKKIALQLQKNIKDETAKKSKED